MGEKAANPHRCGLGVERGADALAFEVLRRPDAGPPVDIDVTVAEHPRWKYRQRHQSAVAARHPADEFGRRELRRVELFGPTHPVENLPRGFDAEVVEIDAFDGDFAGSQRFHAIVFAAGEGQSEARHAGSMVLNFGHNPLIGRHFASLPSRRRATRGCQ
jgi:hypothetical protein